MLEVTGNQGAGIFRETFSGKDPKPLTIPTFSLLGRGGFSKNRSARFS
jgi:hypothetical protein